MILPFGILGAPPRTMPGFFDLAQVHGQARWDVPRCDTAEKTITNEILPFGIFCAQPRPMPGFLSYGVSMARHVGPFSGPKLQVKIPKT